MKYKIYHIEGVKIGCSINPQKRVKKQGYDNFTILEEYNDINIASQREIELQKKYGYTLDCTPYNNTVCAPTIEGVKKGGESNNLKKWQLDNPEEYKKNQLIGAIKGGITMGKIQGEKNKESGHISNLGKRMSDYNNRLQKCPYCNIETRGAAYVRWHGENCRHKKL